MTTMRHRGFTLLEVTLVSGLMAVLAVLLGAAWSAVGRPAADVIARSRLFQEMDMAVAALSRDLGGSLANPDGRLGTKQQGSWNGWMNPDNDQLWLCFAGVNNTDGDAHWGPPDNVIIYQISSGTLVRADQNAGTAFTVAKYLDTMDVSSNGPFVQIRLIFTYRDVSRTCTLLARHP
jgi:prepilin-type N-terminal cleavage/methylation domain-containing protein